jgi:hypothetical protein
LLVFYALELSGFLTNAPAIGMPERPQGDQAAMYLNSKVLFDG